MDSVQEKLNPKLWWIVHVIKCSRWQLRNVQIFKKRYKKEKIDDKKMKDFILWQMITLIFVQARLSSVMSVMSVMSVNVTWWISSVRCLLLPPPDSDTNTAVGTERMEGSQRRERSWPSPRPSPPHPPTPLQPSSSFHIIFFHLRNKENVSVEPVIIIC